MKISNWMAALALVNGTTGGVVLVLPIIGLDAGWLMIPILIFIASLCCYYTATLMFMHLGKAQTINKSIMNHFGNQKFCEFYNLTMFASFFGEMILYFDLLVSESQGLLYFAGEQIQNLIPFLVAGFLVALGLLARYYHLEESLLGYGILSMIAYAIFIAWSIVTRQPGPKSLPMVDGEFIDLGAAMSQGFSIHNMMIPIILRAQDPHNYKKILGNVFVIGAILYTFIAYGSLALVNRVPINGAGETVEDFFMNNEWQIYLLRAIYIINIVTVFPEFLSISKQYVAPKQRIRFFNLFWEEEQSQHFKISVKQVAYFIGVIAICLIAKILHFRAPVIIELNGSIICFMQIYLIPIGIHLKCIWMSFTKTDQPQQAIEHAHMQPNSKELKQIQNHQNVGVLGLGDDNMKTSNDPNDRIDEIIDEVRAERCPFHEEILQDKGKIIRQMVKSLIVLSYGIFVMLYTFYTVFFKKQS